MFNDGSEAGKNTLMKITQFRCENVVTDFRRKLLRLYQEKGLDALLEAIGANL